MLTALQSLVNAGICV